MIIHALLLSLTVSPAGAAETKLPGLPVIPALDAKVSVPAKAPDLPAAGALPQVPSEAAKAPAAAPSAAEGPLKASLGDMLRARAPQVQKADAADRSGLAGRRELEGLYSGALSHKDPAADPVFVINDEGVRINGRARAYYGEVRRLVDLYKGELDLRESLDVMDDTYAAVWAKLKVLEGVAQGRGVAKPNTHLEKTLTWVDGTLEDHGKTVAVHTHQVYFHHASNRKSEVEEGIRRVDRYLEEALAYFRPGGKAEQALGGLDEVVLGFDVRGYKAIRRHLEARERELAARGQRYRFAFVEDFARVPRSAQGFRDRLNELSVQYEKEGLQRIIEGVIYSRYTGLLLELKALEHYKRRGYDVLQSGRDLFDATGRYVTELDAVVRSPGGRTIVVEAKSARVELPQEDVLRDKILYKLETYQKNRALMEKSIGSSFDVVFAIDVGTLKGLRGQRNRALIEFLQGKEEELSRRYGFEVSFLFLQSGPTQEEQR